MKMYLIKNVATIYNAEQIHNSVRINIFKNCN